MNLGYWLASFVLLAQAPRQEKQPPGKEEHHYARAEIRGKLVRMGLKEKTWNVVVGWQKEGEGAFFCPLTFAKEKMEQEAKRLDGKVVIVTGEIVPNNNALPGIGGESFLFVPGPIIYVRTLRLAEKK